MAVGDKTPKQGSVKVFQFASKFVGYNHFASVLRVKDAYFQVQLQLWKHRKFQYGLHGEIFRYSLFNISGKNRPNFLGHLH